MIYIQLSLRDWNGIDRPKITPTSSSCYVFPITNVTRGNFTKPLTATNCVANIFLLFYSSIQWQNRYMYRREYVALVAKDGYWSRKLATTLQGIEKWRRRKCRERKKSENHLKKLTNSDEKLGLVWSCISSVENPCGFDLFKRRDHIAILLWEKKGLVMLLGFFWVLEWER